MPSGPLSPALQFAARVAFIDSTALSVWDNSQELTLAAIGKSGEPRLAWIISDMLRFVTSQQAQVSLTRTVSELFGETFDSEDAWHGVTNYLLAWDIPALPDYLKYKRAIFTLNIPCWENLFEDGFND